MINITNPKKFFINIILLILIALVAFRVVWGSGEIEKTGDVTIAQGAKASDVWRMLVDDGYADRTIPWKYYGRVNNAAAKIQAGTYHIEEGENISDIVDRFAKGDTKSDEFSVTFPEGFTVSQIAARLKDRGITDADAFTRQAVAGNYAEKFPFLNGLPATRSLEGYLFPDTYRITPGDTSNDVIMRMLGNFDRKVTKEIRDEAVAQGRTLDDVINMASIVEKEVLHKQDMGVVSGILWKRLDNKEGLYTDATLEYIVNKNGELTVQDLAKDTPYNTRKYRGLPPTPIDNPGLLAILAALRPEKSEYYYYLTNKEGETIFAKTNEEHNRNKVKYL
jgi:UPF0755 protein